MELKVSLEFDIDDYLERWSEDSLAKDIEESIKQEALKAVKQTTEYKAMVAKTQEAMMRRLLND